jgi:hypothetical protein
MKVKSGIGIGTGLLVIGAWPLSATDAGASAGMQKKAKEAGFAAASCLYCHNEKLPKKGASTENDRGKFLVAEKDKRKASEADVTWLKDYKEQAQK